MERERIEMGKSHPSWDKNYATFTTMMEQQTCELRALYRKVLKMRYETSLVALNHLKATKILQQTQAAIESLEAQQGAPPL